MGTVYRNLKILVDQNTVRKIEFGSTFDRFEANTAPHYHLVCETCGAIKDLGLEIDESLNYRVDSETPFTARSHRIEFYGLCDACSPG